MYGDRWIGTRPSTGARARLDFSDVESPNSRKIKNKENQNDSNSQTTREKQLYQSLLHNELQGQIMTHPFLILT